MLVEVRQASDALNDISTLVHHYQCRCAERRVILSEIVKVHQYRVADTTAQWKLHSLTVETGHYYQLTLCRQLLLISCSVVRWN